MPPVPIYLDFDGVMNSFSRDAQRLTTRTGFGRWRFVDSKHQEEGRCFPLALSDDRNQEVSSWCGLGAEIVWLTTWWQAPDDVIAQTGIDAPFAAPRASLTGSRDWKAAVIESRHGNDDHFVCIDDADVPSGFARRYPSCLVVRPSDRFGLFARDAIRVRDFLINR